ncbi:MAG: hypothetical protein HDS91_00650 [Bacteroidales bacterium]|nr:hypothetical protein [Bacteroidales bacterium]
MIESIKIGSLIKLTATTGLIHKIGTETYAKSVIMRPSETMEMYEEVAEMPTYTKEQYDAKVAELVREKYTDSEEHAIRRKAFNVAFSLATVSEDGNAALNEYQEYNAYVEDCKLRAKDADLYKTPEQLEAEREEQLENERVAEDVENDPEELPEQGV